MNAETSVNKILIRSPNWVGDQVLAFPFFYFLRKRYPQAKITAVCVPWVKDLQFRDLIDDVVVVEKPDSPRFLAKLEVVHQACQHLKARGPFDLAISLPNSFSTAYLLWKAGSKRRRGYRGDLRGFLLNEKLKWDPDPNRHRAQAYLDLLPRSPGDGVPPASQFWPKTRLSPSDRIEEELQWKPVLKEFDAAKAWPNSPVLEPPPGRYWVLGPGATAISRRWSTESFGHLAQVIFRTLGLKGLIVGGSAEAPLAERLVSGSPHLINFTARGPVTSLSKVFRMAEFTVCNESGLAHVASLCGSPVQIICGAADPRRTQPIGPGAVQVTVNPVECWPCERNTCSQPSDRELQCLRGIFPDDVFSELLKLVRDVHV